MVGKSGVFVGNPEQAHNLVPNHQRREEYVIESGVPWRKKLGPLTPRQRPALLPETDCPKRGQANNRRCGGRESIERCIAPKLNCNKLQDVPILYKEVFNACRESKEWRTQAGSTQPRGEQLVLETVCG